MINEGIEIINKYSYERSVDTCTLFDESKQSKKLKIQDLPSPQPSPSPPPPPPFCRVPPAVLPRHTILFFIGLNLAILICIIVFFTVWESIASLVFTIIILLLTIVIAIVCCKQQVNEKWITNQFGIFFIFTWSRLGFALCGIISDLIGDSNGDSTSTPIVILIFTIVELCVLILALSKKESKIFNSMIQYIIIV